MQHLIQRTARAALGVLAAGLLAAPAPAQVVFPLASPLPVPDVYYPIVSQVRPGPDAARLASLGQIEVYNGAQRTVHYVAPGLTEGERSALRDLERAENEAAYADDLQALKRKYVDSELLLEPYRRFMQERFWGYNKQMTSGLFGGGGYGNPGWGGYYPYAYNSPYSLGWGGQWGSYFGGGITDVSFTLGTGVGYEGPLKDAMARGIAAEATPEYGTAAARAANAALGRAAATSDRLARGLGVAQSDVRPATGAPRIVLTLKSGDKVEGTLYGEDADWFRVETPTGTTSVRKADVSRVEMPKK